MLSWVMQLTGNTIVSSLGSNKSEQGMRKRIMYIEDKSESLNGPARIGYVEFSKSGKSIKYKGRIYQTLSGGGFKANYFDTDTGEHFWISGPRRDGRDRLYPESSLPVEIDEDAAEEYWRDIRGKTDSA